MTTVTYGIADTGGDASYIDAAGLLDGLIAGDAQGFFGAGAKCYAGMRFLAVAVPQGATITSATLTLKLSTAPVLGANVLGSTFGSIKGVAANNAADWAVTDPKVAAKTTASVTITSGSTVGYNVAAIVQEIVNRVGWVTGNALAFATDPTGTPNDNRVEWEDYSTSAVNCPQLSITYTATSDTGAGSASGAGAAAAVGAAIGTIPGAAAASGAGAAAAVGSSVPSMTFVGSATGTNTATMPAHQVGDYIVAFSFVDGSATPPSIPAGQNWSAAITTGGANTCGAVSVAKVAASTGETVGTFTNGTTTIVMVYRPATDFTLSTGVSAQNGASSTTINYPALSGMASNGLSWVVGFAGHRSVNTALETPPTGMTNRATVVDATDEGAGHDSNGNRSSWSSTNVTAGGTSSGYRSAVIEIAATYTAPGGTISGDGAASGAGAAAGVSAATKEAVGATSGPGAAAGVSAATKAAVAAASGAGAASAVGVSLFAGVGAASGAGAASATSAAVKASVAAASGAGAAAGTGAPIAAGVGAASGAGVALATSAAIKAAVAAAAGVGASSFVGDLLSGTIVAGVGAAAGSGAAAAVGRWIAAAAGSAAGAGAADAGAAPIAASVGSAAGNGVALGYLRNATVKRRAMFIKVS